ncbi:hypothetical protein GCM10023092_16080 [Rurimicrobium arvi]|uniref:Uncharacterized protein n=1 Tax=Rurimicrobium arvi TaxID=2049916 RepID=A0ABP8MTU6_9BACT
MKLIDIKDRFYMDTGAPNPLALFVGSKVVVSFWGSLNDDNEQENSDTVVITFTGCIKSSFGLPNNETLHGHPYYKFGLRSYGFY